MQRILLATAAAALLSLPVHAQQPSQSGQSQSGQSSVQKSGQTSGQSQTQNQNQNRNQQSQAGQGQSGSQNQAANQQPVDATQLSRSQISQIQKALNKKGFSSGDVDGQWGPDTRAALENFKRRQGYATGENQLDPRTLQALDLDASQFRSDRSTTTGQGGSSSGGASGSMNDRSGSGWSGQSGQSGQSGGNQ
ncbi:LPXTG-motif cell wall anchor domain protein [Rhodovulum sp. PH10]|uniref:peptidoglycan-binding domain-containing protein n=1 Tax=Rhodovulum sp. PH10 TaxID=1187851 RepID=UPI00027C2050|nr:peptidoglycan-binding domain-containing protein [Rhodovulum sp. PH10]EJW11419.1 LPXTG-motif cell wall anchor domain protein [Rhodovulum sp. PH10]